MGVITASSTQAQQKECYKQKLSKASSIRLRVCGCHDPIAKHSMVKESRITFYRHNSRVYDIIPLCWLLGTVVVAPDSSGCPRGYRRRFAGRRSPNLKGFQHVITATRSFLNNMLCTDRHTNMNNIGYRDVRVDSESWTRSLRLQV